MKKVLFMLAMFTCMFASCSDGGSDIPETPNPTPQPEETASITLDSDIVSNGLVFDEQGGEKSVEFSANKDWTLTIAAITGGTDWCTVSEESGSKGDATVKFTVTENTESDDRSVSVTIKAGAASKSFKITQEGVSAYANGVVTVTTAGTLKQLLGSDYLEITSLKVVGPINGDDVYVLRGMLAAGDINETQRGKLTELDLSEAMIVEGGGSYYIHEYNTTINYYTANNEIGDFMFNTCYRLQNIILPDGITSIGNFAFQSTPLTSITIPDSVKEIGDNAFRMCTHLTSITISDGVEKIGKKTFYACISLTSITIPDSVTEIGANPFLSCDSLMEFICKYASKDGRCIVIDGVLVSFAPGGLTEYTIPDGVTKIGDDAFRGCLLTSITIPDSVIEIGSGAFYKCTSLTSITIPDSVTKIGGSAFSHCTSLTSITLPDGVTSIGDFMKCTSLTSITIPNGVTEIGMWDFMDCTSLTSITLPSSITKIVIGAFDNCTSLSEVYCYATEPPTIDQYSFASNIATLYVPAQCGTKYEQSNWGLYSDNIIEMD